MRNVLIILLLLGALVASGQNVLYTKTGHIWFFSSTPIEDIEAHNKTVMAAFDSKNNVLEFKVKMTDFIFEKALMQEHFNENYVESHKYPHATFKGKIDNFSELNLETMNTFEAKVSGVLKIHGVERNVSAKGTLKKNSDVISMNSKFQVKPADYNIKIPKIVVKNIAEVVDVYVDMSIRPLKK